MDRLPRKRASKPELLAPGGSLEKLRIAFLYGADAVYASGKDFGLRGFARNLDTEELAAASVISHRLGKRLYVTVNIFAREPDLKKLPAYLEYLGELGVDALIISDPGVLALARKYAPEIPLHLSTQANTTNSSSVDFWHEQGVCRINLARELSLAEIAGIAGKSKAEIEVFVHGAMCMSYSGRCLMSAFLNLPGSPPQKGGEKGVVRPGLLGGWDRSANGGFCTQPCRWSWGLVEEKRPGEVFPVEEDRRGTYIFNSKDLCLIEDIGELARAGVDSFKIEGRMKGPLYLASVTRAYRHAIDLRADRRDACKVEPAWLEDLEKVSHRPYTKGNLYGNFQDCDANVETRISYVQTHTLAGLVRAWPDCDFPAEEDHKADGRVFMEVRSKLVPGMRLEFLNPDGSSSFHLLDSFEDVNGNRLARAHPNSFIRFRTDFRVFPLEAVRVARQD
jgi:putative protease